MNTIVSVHNAGFFSCCSVKLTNIVDYINSNSKIPDSIDSSKQFSWYKRNNDEDITYEYFEHYDNICQIINYGINYHWEHQFINYNNLDFTNIIPVVKKYFSPSKNR